MQSLAETRALEIVLVLEKSGGAGIQILHRYELSVHPSDNPPRTAKDGGRTFEKHPHSWPVKECANHSCFTSRRIFSYGRPGMLMACEYGYQHLVLLDKGEYIGGDP